MLEQKAKPNRPNIRSESASTRYRSSTFFWRFQNGFESFGLIVTFGQFLIKTFLGGRLRKPNGGKKDEAV